MSAAKEGEVKCVQCGRRFVPDPPAGNVCRDCGLPQAMPSGLDITIHITPLEQMQNDRAQLVALAQMRVAESLGDLP